MQKIRIALTGKSEESFRTPRGVQRRLYEFQYLDRKSENAKKSPEGARNIWNAWGEKPHAGIMKMIEAINKCISAEEVQSIREIDIDNNYSAVESQILTRVHTVRERNRKVIILKKEKFKDENKGDLYCEACKFNFAHTYRGHGDEFIECHHIKPLSELYPGEKTTLDDLALLCSNCHRMVHYKHPWLDMRGLDLVLNRTR